MRTIDPDHQDRGQRCELDANPHQPEIVGQQREIHLEHQSLIHRVIEPQVFGASRPVSSSCPI